MSSEAVPEIKQSDIDIASKKNIFGLATVGFACCGGTIALAFLNVPILGAIIGFFGLGTLSIRFLNFLKR